MPSRKCRDINEAVRLRQIMKRLGIPDHGRGKYVSTPDAVGWHKALRCLKDQDTIRERSQEHLSKFLMDQKELI